MKLTNIKDIFKNKISIDSLIKINGWVKNKRISKSNLIFIDLYDGSFINTLQIVSNNKLLNYYTEIIKLTTGCSISVKGKLIKSFKDKEKLELHVLELNVLGWVKNPNFYPISSKKHTMEHLRKFSHLRSRTNIIGAISRIRSVVFQGFHNYFYKNGYYWVPSPIITSINSEGAGEMFSVLNENFKENNIDKNNNFFGKKVFLTVSGQLTIESYACSISKVYTFGPIFRAENSNTTRHLSEFWMLEVELAFLNLNKIIHVIEKILKYVISLVLKNNYEDLLFLKKNINENIIFRLKKFVSSKIKKINYVDAVKILKENYNFNDNSIFFGMDLNSDHEKFLVDKYFKAPLIILNYPKELKPFYMRINDDNKTVSNLDILFPGVGEIIGGSQREERIKYLEKRILELKLNKKHYKWYRDLRNYGTVPHSGFGLGLERLIMYITGIKNIKDVIPFPRTIKNADF
ncbi:MAG: asparagine--tRNA ligase [Buchnera aphidicola (Periphyllus lyropictus)]|uniref:asparagine--tRNA ligase n=1 Tax=Buchnera aphidicola TaxID=9 RepID=UPI001ED5AF5D|nr:asparagine--tRNA ligase [Buchnera aphidicola]NIH16586.1 asparagine--tRNA ligase [Buchnera aphidicola (Periphyllus lyropictus)]USS94476.1 asparagine--tRNA ligase [Buchnera aphidicola (Periphyllus lyropictus)]